MGFDKIVVERTVYNADDWLGVVGGFMGSVEFIFIVLVPMLNIWNLEKYLVTTYFFPRLLPLSLAVCCRACSVLSVF